MGQAEEQGTMGTAEEGARRVPLSSRLAPPASVAPMRRQAVGQGGLLGVPASAGLPRHRGHAGGVGPFSCSIQKQLLPVHALTPTKAWHVRGERV